MKLGDIAKIKGRWAISFALTATSAKWYKWIFVIKNKVKGYFDIKNNQTLFFTTDKIENDYREIKQVQFDYKRQHLIEKDTTGGKVTYRQFMLKSGVIDSYSIIYLIRQSNLRAKKNIKYSIYSGGEVHHYEAKFLGANMIDHHGHKIKALKVELLTKIQGAMEQKGGIYVYLSDDKRRIPLRVQADVAVGKFVVELSKKSQY